MIGISNPMYEVSVCLNKMLTHYHHLSHTHMYIVLQKYLGYWSGHHYYSVVLKTLIYMCFIMRTKSYSRSRITMIHFRGMLLVKDFIHIGKYCYIHIFLPPRSNVSLKWLLLFTKFLSQYGIFFIIPIYRKGWTFRGYRLITISWIVVKALKSIIDCVPILNLPDHTTGTFDFIC